MIDNKPGCRAPRARSFHTASLGAMGRTKARAIATFVAGSLLATGCSGSPLATGTNVSASSSGRSSALDLTHLPSASSADEWCATVLEAADMVGFNQRLGVAKDQGDHVRSASHSPNGPMVLCMGDGVSVSALEATDDTALASFWADQDAWNLDFPTQAASISRGDTSGKYLYYSDASGLDVELELAQGFRAVTVSLLLPLPELDEATARDQAIAVAEGALALPLPPTED